MSCPDRFALLTAGEERSGEAWEHSTRCAFCQGTLAREKELEAGLFRLRDPSPPGDLLAGIMARVVNTDAERRANARQLAAGFGIAAIVLAAIAALFGQEAFVAPAVEGLRSVAALGTAFTAVGRALLGSLPTFVVPVLAIQTLLFMFGCVVMLRRALAPAR